MIIEGKVSLKKTYPYSQELYTQGIELVSNQKLLISSGRYQHSRVGLYDLEDSSYQDLLYLSDNEFAEGIALVGNSFWLLTYREGRAYRFDKNTLKYLETANYTGEGWGLAYDKSRECLWMTSGNAFIQKRDPNTFELQKKVMVTVDGVPISMLNELECVEGVLYANIWQTNIIVKLSPEDGRILSRYDMTELLEKLELNTDRYPTLNVLNGIAHMGGNRFMISGKFFPVLMEVELSE